ncbi:MAG: hypothetical protein PHE09_16660 [Oscillospiraceae bacterium]|nr:hypothetical protein [Oscillospiraceae bacterium]
MTLQELDDCEELSELRDDLKSARRCCASMRRQIRRLKHKQVDKPLTLKELPCFEPIYVVPLGSSVGEWSAHWCIYQIDNAMAESDTHKGRMWFLYDTDYGKTWLAYDHKPEEGEKG